MNSYEPEDLSLNDPSSLDWALAWARFIAKDVPKNDVYPVWSISDQEWKALLNATAKNGYFFPFEAVAIKIETDPLYATQLSMSGYSQTFRTAGELANAIRNRYSAVLAGYYTDTTITSPFELHVVW